MSIWPFKTRAPEPPTPREIEEKSETIRAKAAKRAATFGLLDALRSIEIERDLSEALSRPPPRRNGKQ
jgi:hypothetical protein